jgi:uncharacterized protein (TIGR02996 family)
VNQEDAFIADVIDHPDDEAPRLIFADWLEDHGQSERAEFIRTQIDSHRLDVYDPRQIELAAREKALLKRFTSKWMPGLKSHLSDWTFRRGLLDEVVVRVEMLLRHADKLAAHPIQTLYLVFQAGDVDRADQVAACAALANVSTLVIQGNLTASAVGELARSDVFTRLKRLGLASTHVSDDAVKALVSGPVARQLEALDLTSNTIRISGAEYLARGDLQNLKILLLSGTGLGNGGVEALAASRRLPQLHKLDLSENSLDVKSARALAGCSRLAGLRRLNLAGNSIRSDGAVALARSRHLRQLERLQLRSNGIGETGAAEFGKAGFLDSMEYLELSGNSLGEAGLRSILQSRPTRLEFLLLGTDELDDGAMRELALWPGLEKVRELNLYNNQITAFGMRALIDSPYAKNLCRMNLECNRLKDLGVEVLSVWPGLAAMRWLKLRQNDFTDKGALALARSPHLEFLSDLDLSQNNLSDESKAAYTSPPVRERVRRLAPWDTPQIDYYPPFTPQRPRG